MVDSSFTSRVAVLADAQVCHNTHCSFTICCTGTRCCISVFVAPGRTCSCTKCYQKGLRRLTENLMKHSAPCNDA